MDSANIRAFYKDVLAARIQLLKAENAVLTGEATEISVLDTTATHVPARAAAESAVKESGHKAKASAPGGSPRHK